MSLIPSSLPLSYSLALFGVASAAYLGDLQAQPSNQFSSFSNGNGGYGGNNGGNNNGGYGGGNGGGNGGFGGGNGGFGGGNGGFGGGNGGGRGAGYGNGGAGGFGGGNNGGFGNGGNGFGNGGRNNGGYGGGDPIADLADAIPGGGVPGQDYPILASVPATGFSCDGQLPGYYADTAPEAGCQVSAESLYKWGGGGLYGYNGYKLVMPKVEHLYTL